MGQPIRFQKRGTIAKKTQPNPKNERREWVGKTQKISLKGTFENTKFKKAPVCPIEEHLSYDYQKREISENGQGENFITESAGAS